MSNGTNNPMKGMGGAKPKHDYDGDAFYDEIFANAMQGMKDCEIADALGLNPLTFTNMKNGNYYGWDEETNRIRSERICKVLERARRKINAIVRGRYLKVALGGIKVKNKCVTKKKLKVGGEYTDDLEVITTESENETPPNMNALAVWLFHHDPEWREVQMMKKEAMEEEKVEKAEKTLDIEKWIEKEAEEFDGIGM